jgi:hypothetical protein
MSKRSIVILFAVACLCISFIPQVMAEGLDHACREAQLSVQATVGDPANYKNHGAWVSAAAHAANVFLEAGLIDEECHSCIVSQFGQRIPIAEQTPCGPDAPNPECTGASCGNFLPCNAPNSCSNPVCVTTDDGLGACVEGATPCGALTLCPNGKGDCPAGYICALQTCCGNPVCVGPEAFCTPGAGPIVPLQATSGATIASPTR